jgi:hypothetical protein
MPPARRDSKRSGSGTSNRSNALSSAFASAIRRHGDSTRSNRTAWSPLRAVTWSQPTQSLEKVAGSSYSVPKAEYHRAIGAT